MGTRLARSFHFMLLPYIEQDNLLRQAEAWRDILGRVDASHLRVADLDLFAAYGFERVSVDDIALSAGISRP